MTKLNITGLFGYPVEHSLSPAMHNAAYNYLGLNYIYVPFLVTPENIGNAVKSLKALNICGLNVTVPHKENALKFVDTVDRTARKIGAINTIIFDGKKLKGYNTDGFGFVKSLEGKLQLKNKKALLLGAGGAGKSIGIVLSESEAKEIFLYDLNTRKARQLALKMNLCKKTHLLSSQNEVNRVIREADLLINASPIGMNEGDPCVIEPGLLHRNLFVYDIVYNRATEVIKNARKKGCKCLNGLEMLLYQGVLAFELWTHKKAPVEVMRKALLNGLKV